MISRITHQTIQRQTLANLQGNLTSMAALQAQMSSGKKINVPSDDPAGAATLLDLQRQLAQNTQYQRNAGDGNAWQNRVAQRVGAREERDPRERDQDRRYEEEGARLSETLNRAR